MNYLPLFTPPNVEEMMSRRNKVIKLMAKENIDCMVITDPDNVYWLTNFANYVHERPFILLLNQQGELSFIVPKLEVMHVESRVIGQLELLTYDEFPCPAPNDWQSVFDCFIKCFDNAGVEEVSPVYVKQALPSNSVVTEIMEQARYVKSDYEISRIVYSSNIATKAMEKLLKMAKPGVSALTVHSKLSKLMMLQILADNPEMNALATNVAAVVQPPNVSHDPHNFTNVMDMDMVMGGPHVSIINGVMNGYGTEVERTFFLGKVPKEAVRPYEVMMEARALTFEICKPGVDMHDVDHQVMGLFKRHGYGQNTMHRTGHSIGVTGHEGPFLAEGFNCEIKENMLFTIEPGIYIEGLGGFRHSDTVLVTKSGSKSLTPVRDSLKDMTLKAKSPIISLSAASKQKMLKRVNKLIGLNA